MTDKHSISPGRQFGSSDYSNTRPISTGHNTILPRQYPSSQTMTSKNQTTFHNGPKPKLCPSGSHMGNVRHPRFYFSDGNIIFSVCTVLFKVHRYFFHRDSPVFSSMFELLPPPPPPPGEEIEGETDEKPIELSGFTSKDFERFLEVLYPKDFCISELTGIEAWVSALTIATQWDFTSIRSLAIAKLSDLLVTSAERVAVEKQFDVEGWLGPAYMDLCIREEPLSLQEGQKLGIEDIIEIYRLLNLIRYNANLHRHPDSIRTLVRQEFK